MRAVRRAGGERQTTAATAADADVPQMCGEHLLSSIPVARAGRMDAARCSRVTVPPGRPTWTRAKQGPPRRAEPGGSAAYAPPANTGRRAPRCSRLRRDSTNNHKGRLGWVRWATVAQCVIALRAAWPRPSAAAPTDRRARWPCGAAWRRLGRCKSASIQPSNPLRSETRCEDSQILHATAMPATRAAWQ